MRIVWLASYPRSGNTYVRFLLYNYLFRTLRESVEIRKHIPDIHELLETNQALDVNADVNLLVKTHFCLEEGHPYYSQTTGFVYILRNPRDVLLSNSRYSGVTGNKAIDVREFAISFIDNLGVPQWRRMNMGSWPEHFCSWFAATSRFPGIFIKYEDLIADPQKVLAELVSFLGQEPEETRIRAAVENSSINAMRRLEESERKHGRSSLFEDQGKANFFVGKAGINQSLAHLGEDIEDSFEKRFGNFVRIFGYQ